MIISEWFHFNSTLEWRSLICDLFAVSKEGFDVFFIPFHSVAVCYSVLRVFSCS
mgnify:CR=1 FL=1